MLKTNFLFHESVFVPFKSTPMTCNLENSICFFQTAFLLLCKVHPFICNCSAFLSTYFAFKSKLVTTNLYSKRDRKNSIRWIFVPYLKSKQNKDKLVGNIFSSKKFAMIIAVWGFYLKISLIAIMQRRSSSVDGFHNGSNCRSNFDLTCLTSTVKFLVERSSNV